MTTWMISTTPGISALVDLAATIGQDTVLIDLGNAASPGVDRIVRIAHDGVPAEALAPAVAEAVTAADGDTILVRNGAAERAVAGALAAKLGAPVVAGASAVASGSATVSRFGGISVEHVTSAKPLVVLVDGGAPIEGSAPEAEAGPGTSFEAWVTATAPTQGSSVNLSSAKRIVAVGRGFKAEEDLGLAREFAAAIGAEVACSRPVAEGSGWMPKEVYVGVTGQHVAPAVYVAVGISGQLQHMVGAHDAGAIVVINNDAKAPVFSYADYGIVGDLYEVLPALTAAAK